MLVYWRVLTTSRVAVGNTKDIKAAYKRQALRWHPVSWQIHKDLFPGFNPPKGSLVGESSYDVISDSGMIDSPKKMPIIIQIHIKSEVQPNWIRVWYGNMAW